MALGFKLFLMCWEEMENYKDIGECWEERYIYRGTLIKEFDGRIGINEEMR